MIGREILRAGILIGGLLLVPRWEASAQRFMPMRIRPIIY
jgi:hypothetical protein